MHKTRMTTRSVLLALATLMVLSGCGTTARISDWLSRDDESAGDEAVIIGAPDAESYLAELYKLASGDARRQAAIFDDASAAARLTPGPSSTSFFR